MIPPREPAEPGESRLGIQLRVLFALVMREMATRYGRSAGGYLWAILDPLATIAVLSAVFTLIARAPPLGQSFALFFATGYMAFHIYRDIAEQVSNAILFNLPLMNFPRITLLDAVLARFILQLLTSTLTAGLVLGGLLVWTGEPVSLHFGPIFAAGALAALLGLGVGALNCVLFAYWQTWRRVFAVINRPLFIISGIMFLHESMPPAIQAALWWNPLSHVTALMRSGFYAVYTPTFVSAVYVALTALAPLAFGILLLRTLKRGILDQ